MTELAEENLGIPALVTEKDLMINFPNIFLAQLVQLIAFKHTLEKSDIDRSKAYFFQNMWTLEHLAEISAPKLVFEARNGMDAQFPRCPSCHEHVFFLERVTSGFAFSMHSVISGYCRKNGVAPSVLKMCGLRGETKGGNIQKNKNWT